MQLYGVLLKQSEHLMQCKKLLSAALEDSTRQAHVLWANRQNSLFPWKGLVERSSPLLCRCSAIKTDSGKAKKQYYRNFQKQCLLKRHIYDMQFADAACALKTQTAIKSWIAREYADFGRAQEKVRKTLAKRERVGRCQPSWQGCMTFISLQQNQKFSFQKKYRRSLRFAVSTYQ